ASAAAAAAATFGAPSTLVAHVASPSRVWAVWITHSGRRHATSSATAPASRTSSRTSLAARCTVPMASGRRLRISRPRYPDPPVTSNRILPSAAARKGAQEAGHLERGVGGVGPLVAGLAAGPRERLRHR